LSGGGFNRDGQAEAGMGVSIGDVDGDGDPDIVVANFDTETNTLYRNEGDWRFEDDSAASGFGLPSFNFLGFGMTLRDFNRDGYLDAYVANGHILENPDRQGVSYAERDLLMLGDGKRFQAARCGPAFEQEAVGRGIAAADYDNDGDVDLAVLNSGERMWLLRNRGRNDAWFGIRLKGRRPNTGAIGARVTLRTEATHQVRWVLAGDSYQSSSDQRPLFVLRSEDPAREVEVAWPSGTTTRLPFSESMVGKYTEISE
jgi:hypothetical protein